VLHKIYGLLFLCIFSCTTIAKPEDFSHSHPSTHSRVNQSAVVSAHPLATQTGMDILAQGGNAFDAAIAISSMLTVVEPYHSGIGGGGFWLCRETEGNTFIIDAREVAPAKASVHMYMDEKNRLNHKLSKVGGLAVAIPGEVAAWAYLSQKGKLSLSKVLAPAIQVAYKGFALDKKFAEHLKNKQKILSHFPSSQAIFFKDDKPLQENDNLVQKDLAKLLEAIGSEGAKAFYQGDVAQKLVKSVNQHGGIWSLDDLSRYKVQIRDPIRGEYEGMQVTTMGPPSAGGIALLNALNILSEYELMPLAETDKIHLIAESLRRSYCDRAHYIGDPDFESVPTTKLISEENAESWRKSIDINKATSSKNLNCLPKSDQIASEGETTHYVVKDQFGNMISATTTVNFPFGSGLVAEGLGIILNNEMDDFATGTMGTNGYGLLNTSVNAIAPNKRPVSSMTPTIVETEEGIALLGTPGGSRIPSMMLIALLELSKTQKPTAWVSKPRFHHQYLPDILSFEPGAFDEPTQKALILRGHKLQPTARPYGNMQALFWPKQGSISVGSDPRGIGKGLIH